MLWHELNREDLRRSLSQALAVVPVGAAGRLDAIAGVLADRLTELAEKM